MFIDYTRPPFIDIPLPPAIILPAYQLIALYTGVLLIDLTLLRNERHLHSFMSGRQLRILMTIYHIIIPLIFVSSNSPLNVFYAACPWFLATYSAHMPMEQLTFINWYRTILAITIEDKDGPSTPAKIRMKGASRMALSVFKIAFCTTFIDPFLPHHPQEALAYPWLHPYSQIYTLLFGIKGYCYLGAIDFVMGLEQVLFGWNMIDLFNYPILSSSPRDFWSRRWNKVVHNLLRDHVFNNYKKNKSIEPTRKVAQSRKEVNHDLISKLTDRFVSFWSTRRGAGLLAFIISGAFHELIVMSASRRITLEHLAFFTIQGIFCMIEVDIRQGVLKQEPAGSIRILCIAFHLLLMSVVGRLFIGPLLRYDFYC